MTIKALSSLFKVLPEHPTSSSVRATFIFDFGLLRKCARFEIRNSISFQNEKQFKRKLKKFLPENLSIGQFFTQFLLLEALTVNHLRSPFEPEI